MARRDRLEGELASLGVTLSRAEVDQLWNYIQILERWNRAINLTALKGTALVRRLVAEPLWVATALYPEGRCVDIGSGNGSPAIPWHICRRFAGLDLVEARRRRATFLRQAVRQIGLGNVNIHAARFEEVIPGIRPADWITLQGVRLTRELMSKMHPLCHKATQIAWFTKRGEPSLGPDRTLEIPDSDRRVHIFRSLKGTTSDGR